jgi:hypothetical protein
VGRSEILNGVLLLLLFPERKILLEKFDDALGISEGLLIDIVDLFEGVRQSLLTEFTGLLVVVHHFVMEHGEVESQTKSDWVAGIQTLRRGLGKLVVVQSTILHSIELVLVGALGNISVVISNHFVEESLGLIGGGNFHALLLNNIDNGDALVIKLTFNLLLVG